jgi:ATP-binding cassette, subfamily B, bacterial
MGDEKDS